VISYQIPAYKLHGVPVLYFAGWKEHYSLYPVSEGLVAELEGQRATYSFSKGTMRLPLGEPVPTRLIARIAKSRAREVTEKHNAKAGAKTQR
jgi:uncharacterized protein YdhG (YjbR/CyaY superfamily)